MVIIMQLSFRLPSDKSEGGSPSQIDGDYFSKLRLTFMRYVLLLSK